jgi:hypothetical protein
VVSYIISAVAGSGLLILVWALFGRLWLGRTEG